jgi:hypothetical protein
MLASCGGDDIPGHGALVKQVERQQIGFAQDHWIEMKNGVGEWERTGLIFGYADDYSECIKAIDGLKAVNYAREYRCVPAN